MSLVVGSRQINNKKNNMNIITSLLLNGLTVYVVSYFLTNVHVDNFLQAIVTGAVLGLINAFIKPIIATLAFPLTAITLGLFTLVINGLMVLLADWLLPGFRVNGILWAIAFSLIISGLNWLIGSPKLLER